MRHFVSNGFNTFRLAVGWAYLTKNQPNGNLNAPNLAKFDKLVNACLDSGAYCIIEIHTYARWNGKIIGQGGPSNSDFAALWTALANHYKAYPKIMFGIMNEPHSSKSFRCEDKTRSANITFKFQALPPGLEPFKQL